jgi:hypothetical protein
MGSRMMQYALASHLRTGDGSAVVCCTSVPRLT